MTRKVFNGCVLCGWILASVGAGLWWLPAGLMVAGVSLVALTLLVAQRVGVTG